MCCLFKKSHSLWRAVKKFVIMIFKAKNTRQPTIAAADYGAAVLRSHRVNLRLWSILSVKSPFLIQICSANISNNDQHRALTSVTLWVVLLCCSSVFHGYRKFRDEACGGLTVQFGYHSLLWPHVEKKTRWTSASLRTHILFGLNGFWFSPYYPLLTYS